MYLASFDDGECLCDRDTVIATIRPFAYQNPAIRNAMFLALRSLLAHGDDYALEISIALSSDDDSTVRETATDDLMYQAEAGDARTGIREALQQRVQDDDAEIRAEALFGLACMKDTNITDIVMQELSADEVFDYVFRAAAKLKDPKLCPMLANFTDINGTDDLIKHALQECGCNIEDDQIRA